MSDAILKTEGVDISPEAVEALANHCAYNAVRGYVHEDAAPTLRALRLQLTASEKDAARLREALRFVKYRAVSLADAQVTALEAMEKTNGPG